jgi:hypothetical protein
MPEFDAQPEPLSRGRRRSRLLWAGGLILALVAGAVLARHVRSPEPVLVTASDDQGRSTGEAATTASSTSTSIPDQGTSTTARLATSTTSTIRARSTTTTASTSRSTTTTTNPTTGTTATTVVIKALGGYASIDHRGDSHYLPLFIGAQDDDGWISQFLIDWGDGSPPLTLAYNPFPCKAMPPSGWPANNYVTIPSDTTNPLVGLDGKPAPSTEHFYSEPGSYTVTVSVRSTACDGSQLQETSRTVEHVVV